MSGATAGAGEELMTQVDGDTHVEALNRDRFLVMAPIVGGVVDKHACRAEVQPDSFDGRVQRTNVAQVAAEEQRGVPHALRQR